MLPATAAVVGTEREQKGRRQRKKMREEREGTNMREEKRGMVGEGQ